ncbi:MAG: ABC transporter ATP-binding protein [Candidatus Kapabacteria bacterium]|nr:ABC transporter ATP-binding protein [Candidatus Kapabacteria bacterium]
MNAINVENITMTYNKGKVKALNGVSFSVKKGEIFGLIGPDGAGKTSLFRILTTLLLADSGYAEVAGFDVVRDMKSIRKIVGYMPGKFSLYQDLTVEENLKFFATIFKTTVKENYHLIKEIYVQIEPFKDRRAGKLSGGMKQKLALCCALIHKPEVLFLDEPTTGVDPVSRKEFWSMLRNLKKEGISILVSTPYMDEANLCDNIALIKDGNILTVNTPNGIVESYKEKLYSIKSQNMYQLILDLRSYEETKKCFAFGESLHVTFKNDLVDLELLNNKLKSNGHENIEITEITPSIEDCFLALED